VAPHLDAPGEVIDLEAREALTSEGV